MQCMTEDSNAGGCLGRCGSQGRRVVHSRLSDASSPGEASSSLPNEVWQVILSWCGLRTSATAAACSSAFRLLHRTVASTPALLARALLEDHGLAGAVASLYGSPVGHPNERHLVRSDIDVAATLRDIVVLSASPSAAATAAAAAAAEAAASAAANAAAAIATAEAVATDGAATSGARSNPRTASLAERTMSACAATGWVSGSAPAFLQLMVGLLCASASAGHLHVAATTLALGGGAGGQVDRALVAAAAAGRRRVVRLLLCCGADPDAAPEAFGPCALHEAARHGYTDIVELLLDAGARVDGAASADATDAAAPFGGRLASVVPLGGRRPSVAPPPINPWQLWPALSGAKRSGAEAIGGSATPRHPQPLRVPNPFAAAAPLSPVSPIPAAAAVAALAPAAALTPASPRTSLHSFFSDAVAAGVATSVQQLGEQQPGTPTAAAAAATSTRWDDDSDDNDEDGSGGARGVGPSAPSTPRAKPPPLAPPLLPRRKPVPLPASRGSLPLMPSLTSAPPLPPAMMLMLQGGLREPRQGPSPLLAACRAGHAGTAALLLRRGAKADAEGGAELLGAAHPDVIHELLSAVSGLAVHLGAALLAAASANRPEVVSALLRHGADPGFRGGMVLTEAAFKGHVEVLAALLAADGARLRASGALANAVELARMWGRGEALQLLTSFAASASA